MRESGKMRVKRMLDKGRAAMMANAGTRLRCWVGRISRQVRLCRVVGAGNVETVFDPVHEFLIEARSRKFGIPVIWRFVHVVLLGCLIQILVGCMPVARDDFSVLENDVLSNLVRNSYSEVNLTPGYSHGALGVGRLDVKKANSLANTLFVGKQQTEVIQLFHEGGGQCTADEGNILRCEFTRRWKLKMDGFDTSDWADENAKFELLFTINKSNLRVNFLELSIIDMTEYKARRHDK
jgi:hypothetical protein